jgi:hypothetical protein
LLTPLLIVVACDVNTTAGALRLLYDVLESDRCKLLNAQVLKKDGRDEITTRGAQCAQLYKTIVAIITKAGTNLGKGKQKVKTESIDTTSGLKTICLARDLKWRWLGPRIKRVREQLAFLKMNLLLISQASQLAQVQLEG